MINAIYLYRVQRWLYKKKIPILPKFIQLVIFLIYNSSIPYQSSIGAKTRFSYGGISVVVHKRTVIGKRCIIGSCVTFGGRSGIWEVPIVGNDVYVGTGSKILGNITIGNNVTIGANAVVLIDLPDNAVAVGIPAKIIKYNKEIEY